MAHVGCVEGISTPTLHPPRRLSIDLATLGVTWVDEAAIEPRTCVWVPGRESEIHDMSHVDPNTANW